MNRACVTASDGVTLAVHAYADIDPQRPTVLAIHGYPDNHHLWDGVAEQLRDHHNGKYNIVAYDVRGAGESERPPAKPGYRFPQLISDVGAVIDSLGVGQVHLLAHDWGSIQGWAAVTDDAVMGKIASFTSISGPHLNYAGKFLRSGRTLRGALDVIRQFLASGYIWFFLCPGLPELMIRSGLFVKVIGAFERIGNSSSGTQARPAVRSTGDYVNGLNLYRANMPAPFLFPGAQPPTTDVPVQTLVPRRDIFVTPALQRFTGSIPVGSRVVPIEGGHWVVTARPDVIARLASEWIDRVANGVAS
jgi:pimeloyl-ACP methyl ester carboxylesterase